MALSTTQKAQAMLDTLKGYGFTLSANQVAAINKQIIRLYDKSHKTDDQVATWLQNSAAYKNQLNKLYKSPSYLGDDNGDNKVSKDEKKVLKTDIHDNLIAAAQGITQTGASYILTNDTDIATANVFTAGLVYTPGGNDRINALQNEDELTGAGTNPTLNATVGNVNDNGGTTINPTLTGIETIHTKFLGDNSVFLNRAVDSIDLRFADAALKTLTIDAIGNIDHVEYDNIGSSVANLAVSNNVVDSTTADFDYQNGVLKGLDDKGTLTVTNVNMARGGIYIGNHGGNEGFEHLNLVSNGNSNALGHLTGPQMKDLTITGNSKSLSLVDTQDLVIDGHVEGVQFNAGNGVSNPSSDGLRFIDATGFNGDLSIDITNAVGGHNDPANSGQKFYTKVASGAGNDTFWTSSDLAASKNFGADVLNGGGGSNTLKLYGANIQLWNDDGSAITDTGSIADQGSLAQITGIQHLEMRTQFSGNIDTVIANMNAFTDNAVTDIQIRNESNNGVGDDDHFIVENISAALASSGNVVLHHAADYGNNDQVWLRLADATGTNDTVALTVVNDLNTTTQYDYTLTTTAMDKTIGGAANGTVENVTINDNDSESNVVTLTNAVDHTGTVTLNGGTKGNFYKVNYADGSDPLLATTVDASKQKSDLFLQVAPAAATSQTVKLGTGNDALLFANAARDAGSLNLLTGNETITDAGGADVVTAIFSKDLTGQPSFSGIETFQTAATANVAMDLSKTGLTTLNLLSDSAVDGANGPNDQYKLGAGAIVKTSIITANGTSAVSTLNFAGSNEDNDPATQIGTFAQVFNGVTLNTSADNLTVNINSKAVGLDNKTHAEKGATSYTLGQLTAQAAKSMTIAVTDELAIAAGATKSATTTVVDNIWAKNLASLTVTAQGDVNLGTITGNATNNNMTSLDATGVLGFFQATDIALGDNAVVKINDGGSIFNALGSAGKNVTITAGNGFNTITGTAQNDTITTGSSNDLVSGDRGDNLIVTGAGSDYVQVKDGNNTVNIGSGDLEWLKINENTGLDASKATNVLTGNGMLTHVGIDTNGDNVFDFENDIAVGTGHDLGIHWIGNTIQMASSTLDGRVALDATVGTLGQTTLAGGVLTADNANAYLLIGAAAAGGVTKIDMSKATAGVFLDYAADGTSDGAGNLTVIGSNGNDAIVLTNAGTNIINAGAGADIISLATGAGGLDTIVVGDGQSTLAGFDKIFNFHAGVEDKLDLSSTNLATATAGFVASGIANVNYQIDANGTLTFQNATTLAGLDIGKDLSLAQALSVAAGKTTSLDTVSFLYDADGSGAWGDALANGVASHDGTIVFQNTAQGTVVDLVGVNSNLGAGGIVIV